MKRTFVVLLIGLALLAAAEAWLRTGGASLASATVGSPPLLAIPSPDRPRVAPLLVVGATFTAGAGLRDDERWTARLAQRVVGADSFSEVLAVAPLAQPAEPILSHLSSFARTGTFRGTAAIVPHERGADVLVIEVAGDALGADPSPFVIEDLPAADAGPAARPPAGGLALLRALDGWRAARDRERDELAVVQLAAADGFVAGAAERARRRLDGLSEAMRTRKPTPEQVAFLRALLLELHGLARSEQRGAAIEGWKQLLGTLRMQQRGIVLVRSGPPLLTMAIATLAEKLAIPMVQVPPFELDPRFRTGPDGHVAAAVHAQLADMVWLALSRRQMVPEAMRAPAAVAAAAEQINSAAHAREGIDGSLVALAHAWIGNRCEFGEEPPPQALTGVGRRGRLVPGVAAETVLSRPPIPDELVVHATARAGALPRLALRHLLGRATLEAKALGPVPGVVSRVQLEYRIAAPASRDVVAWPAYEYTLEASGDDPAFELTDVTITPKVEVEPPK
jgi:hypothetical protein